ncbi:MAG: hypothetical protein Kow0081_0470 [Candidatus Dojkabacteria bacterium]
MKKAILVDIGVITEYLKNGKGDLPKAYEKFTMQITSTTYTELLASTTFLDENLEKEVIEFIKKYFEVINVDEKVALEASRIIRESDVNFATALVAATAVTNSLDLLTDDKKVFEKINGINFVEL